MKRSLFMSVLALAVLFVFCHRVLSPTHSQATRAAAHTTVTTKTFLPEPPVASISVPPKPPPQSLPQPVTDHRRQILDSADVMAAVNAIRLNGTADEKGWAALLLLSCAVYAKPFEQHLKELRAYQASPVAAGSDELSAKQQRAYETLQERCVGVNDLVQKERVSLLREFRAESAVNPGVIGQLHAIAVNASNGDTRWTPAQADAITEGLYGGDAAVAKEAFLALYSSIDENAPGGRDMRTALLFGMAPTYVNPRLSLFESMDLCVSAGLCGPDNEPEDDGSSYSPAELRLMSEYRAAFGAHLDARRILAIR